MTNKNITEQITVLKDAALKAAVSKKAAATFLRSAGIIEEPVKSKVGTDHYGNHRAK